MTDTKRTGQRAFAQDGYDKTKLTNGGYVRKGGTNPPVSQIQTRPPDPAPMRPVNQRQATNQCSDKRK